MRLRILISACVLAAAVACGRSSNEREYRLQGQVLAVAPDKRQATVNHEEIKGFMAAMTMPYNVQDAKQLKGIEPGDLINAKLIVLSNDAYLTDVTKVGSAPLPQAVPEAQAPAASSGFEMLKPGEAVPDAAFVDQDGKARTFGSFKGSPVLMTFIYTKCPMPTFCPLMDRNFSAIQDKLKSDAALNGRVRLLSVSFDPAVDTPPVLKAHARTLKADPETWTFVTGERDDIDQFAMRFGLSIARAMGGDPRDITHTLRTALVDADGKLVKIYVGNEWTPDQVLTDLAPVVRAD